MSSIPWIDPEFVRLQNIKRLEKLYGIIDLLDHLVNRFDTFIKKQQETER